MLAAGRGILGRPMGTNGASRLARPPLPLTLFVSFLIVIVMAGGGGLVAAIVWPIVGTIGYSVDKVSDRMDYLGNCRRLAAFPERSTVYAADGHTVLATLYLDFNRE